MFDININVSDRVRKELTSVGYEVKEDTTYHDVFEWIADLGFHRPETHRYVKARGKGVKYLFIVTCGETLLSAANSPETALDRAVVTFFNEFISERE